MSTGAVSNIVNVFRRNPWVATLVAMVLLGTGGGLFSHVLRSGFSPDKEIGSVEEDHWSRNRIKAFESRAAAPIGVGSNPADFEGPDLPANPSLWSWSIEGRGSSTYRTNADLKILETASLNPEHLRFLEDLIRLNSLDEESSRFDGDNGDGRFEPLELGYQIWRSGQLILFSVGGDPYSSFGYPIRVLPESIGRLDQIEVLDVHQAELETVPRQIGELRALRILRLHRNQIRDLPDSIGNLPALRELVLTQNQLSTLPESVGVLDTLEELSVGENPILKLPNSLENLHSLRDLGVEGRAKEGGLLASLPEGLAKLPELERIRLSHNQICDPTVFFLPHASGRIQIDGRYTQRCRGK